MYTVEELQQIVNKEISFRSEALANKKPVSLYEAVNYSLGMGGKRIRPVLLLIGFNLFSEEIRDALPAAVAAEVFHNFTLLHDDIMDNSDFRRNKPSVHIQFSENTAILSGDAMSFLACQYLLECRSAGLNEVMRLFTKTALEVCEGQQYDMDFEKGNDVSENEYLEMIRLKTAVLLGYCLKAGALLAGAEYFVSDQLYSLGINMGLAFQLQDDLLDSFGDQVTFGKKIGGDIIANKKTYLLVKALESADDSLKRTLINWLTAKKFIPEEKVKDVLDVYTKLGIKTITQNKIDSYFRDGFNILKRIPLNDERKEHLINIFRSIQIRKY